MFSYGVLVLSPESTTSRIRGDLDVRVPRRSARARASVRRWPWSSRRGRSVQVKLIKMGGRLVRHSRRLTGLAGPDYDATISFGLPFESED